MSVIRQITTREVYRSSRLSLREDEVEFPDGTRGTYTVLDKPDFVLVIPEADGGFWLVQQYRYPVGSREWEFPQGGWPPGEDAVGRTPESLAAAELAEETGFRADRFAHLGRLHAVYGYSSQGYDVYVASGLTAGEPAREVTEQDMICEWRSEAQLRDMVRRGELRDAHSLAALALRDSRDGRA